MCLDSIKLIIANAGRGDFAQRRQGKAQGRKGKSQCEEKGYAKRKDYA
jgi:hypothetical protein